MAQFDLIIIIPLLWALSVTLIMYYNILLRIIFPNFFGVKKFKIKKILTSTFFIFKISNNIYVSAL